MMLGEYSVDGGNVRLTHERGDYDLSERERMHLVDSMTRQHARGIMQRRWAVFSDTIVLGEWIDS